MWKKNLEFRKWKVPENDRLKEMQLGGKKMYEMQIGIFFSQSLKYGEKGGV